MDLRKIANAHFALSVFITYCVPYATGTSGANFHFSINKCQAVSD
jgi:hypothetical protein